MKKYPHQSTSRFSHNRINCKFLLALFFAVSCCRGDVVNLFDVASDAGADAGIHRVAGPGGEAWQLRPGGEKLVSIGGVRFPADYTFEVWFQFDPGGTAGPRTLLTSDRYRRYHLRIVEGESIELNFKSDGGGRSLYCADYDFETQSSHRA